MELSQGDVKESKPQQMSSELVSRTGVEPVGEAGLPWFATAALVRWLPQPAVSLFVWRWRFPAAVLCGSMRGDPPPRMVKVDCLAACSANRASSRSQSGLSLIQQARLNEQTLALAPYGTCPHSV